VRLQINEQHRETVPRQELRPGNHGRTIRPNRVQQQNDRRAITLIYPPPGYGVTGSRNRNAPRRKARRQRNRVIRRLDQLRPQQPRGYCQSSDCAYSNYGGS
jgi:hypothetical protein